MIPPSWTKQPSEKRRVAFNAANSLISGDTISSYEAKIFDDLAVDRSATMLAGSSNTDTIVYVWVQAGNTGEMYFLRVKLTTTLGEIIEDDLAIKVQQKHQ